MSNEYCIEPDDRGRWSVRADGGIAEVIEQSYRSQTEAIDSLGVYLRQRGFEMSRLGATEAGGVRMAAVNHGMVQFTLSMPEAAYQAFRKIQDETKGAPGETVAKALGLYRLALDAVHRGLSVGAAVTSDELEIEFTGF